MNEQALLSLIGAMFITPITGKLNLQRLSPSDVQNIVDLAKAYADAREKGKDTEIAYWKDRWEAQNKAHDAEFSSIIAQNTENKRLNAEIKRLRDALERVMRHHIDESISILDNYLEMKDIARVAWKASISPAPVTETTTEFRLRNLPQDTTNVLPKNEDQE